MDYWGYCISSVPSLQCTRSLSRHVCVRGRLSPCMLFGNFTAQIKVCYFVSKIILEILLYFQSTLLIYLTSRAFFRRALGGNIN